MREVKCSATQERPFSEIVSRCGEAITVLYCDGLCDWGLVVGSVVLLVRLQMSCSE